MLFDKVYLLDRVTPVRNGKLPEKILAQLSKVPSAELNVFEKYAPFEIRLSRFGVTEDFVFFRR